MLGAEERLLQREGADVEADARGEVRDAGMAAGEPVREALAVARRADERRDVYGWIAQPRAAPVDDAADAASPGLVEDVARAEVAVDQRRRVGEDCVVGQISLKVG